LILHALEAIERNLISNEQDHYRATEHLQPFVSDEAEAAHAAAVRQYERGQKVAYELGKALEQAHRLLVNHPELIADCETLLKRIAEVTAPLFPAWVPATTLHRAPSLSFSLDVVMKKLFLE
jgi:hypothetical protein